MLLSRDAVELSIAKSSAQALTSAAYGQPLHAQFSDDWSQAPNYAPNVITRALTVALACARALALTPSTHPPRTPTIARRR